MSINVTSVNEKKREKEKARRKTEKRRRERSTSCSSSFCTGYFEDEMGEVYLEGTFSKTRRDHTVQFIKRF